MDVDTPFGGAGEDGFGIGIGLRGAFESNIEWEAGVDYADVGSSDTAIRFDGRYYFSETLAAGAGLSFDDDGTTLVLGIRLEFGP